MNPSYLCACVVASGLVNALLCIHPIAAQIVPDDTLPVGERSQVTGNANIQVNGGARRGGNLFHSFQSFSVPTGGSAYFNNAADVQNIFSRVTGGSASNIDGVIRANGTANLFLLNPNGILFGPNARLNVGGSFIATTANSINFADNFQFSATHPQTTSLLTVSVPIGLQMGTNPGRIAVQGNGYDLSVAVPRFSPIIRGNNAAGLRVPTSQTLALIGGDIDINGGTLTAEQGRIELGSVRGAQVSLSDGFGFTFSYPGVPTFGEIRLSRQALADASGGGSIQVQGNHVSIADVSLVLVQNGGTQSGGSIRVNAAQSLELSGSSPDSQLRGGLHSETVGVGHGADITVSTQQLIAQGGAGTVTRSYSSGDAGNIAVNASDAVQLIGSSSANPSLVSVIGSGTYSSGAGGAVTVSTGRLRFLEGGSVSTTAFGTGKGGTVLVNASDSIELIGQSSNFAQSSLTAITLGSGDAGQLTINTLRLTIQDGGAVSASTGGFGNAGSVTINARESVEISGRPPAPALPSYVGSPAPILPEPIRQALRLPDRPSGNAGSVTINTPRLNISNGANIGVNNEGTGNAGTLQVNANSIVVDRGGAITAGTASGAGGNLDLNVRDVLLLQNNGQITTSAGGNGGNIRIDAGAITALPTENSDIRANSVNARGGNVTINTSGIFGIQPRSQDTPLSDITATGGNSGQNGTVQLNIEQSDPTSRLITLPTAVIDPSRLIAQGCPADQGNSFVISGRGGLPPTPEQELDDDAEWDDRRRLTVPHETRTEDENNQQLESQVSESRTTIPIIEATQWQTAPTGEIILITNTPNPSVQNSLHPSVGCNDRR